MRTAAAHPRPRELLVDEKPDQEPGGVELLQELGFAFPGLVMLRIIGLDMMRVRR